MRFDEMELEAVPLAAGESESLAAPDVRASWGKRLLTLLTDLSLFAALVLALSPLLPQPSEWLHVAALAGFVVVLSYYYFVGAWMLWGKTIGGAIFDVRVVSGTPGAISMRDASVRWAAMMLSLLTAGIGFMFALPDRLAKTRCV